MAKWGSFFLALSLILYSAPSSPKDNSKNKDDVGGLVRSAGTTLLQDFSCDSIGKASQGVIASIQNFKQAVGAIENTSEQCKSAFDQIAALPDMGTIIQSLQAQGTYQDLLKQEQILNNSNSNLLAVSELPAGSPNLALYPNQATIEQTITVASAQLDSDQAALAGQQGVASRESYLLGMQQLDQLGSSLVNYEKDDKGCFKNGSGAKSHLTAGLVGIAGFFLDSPWGLGAAAAGKLLQTLFSLHEGAHFDPSKEAANASEEAQLVAGLSCAIETLGKEHCALYRKATLVQDKTKTQVCKECDDAEKKLQDDLVTLTENQKQNIQAVNDIVNWTNNSRLSSAHNQDDRQKMQKIAGAFQTLRLEFDSNMTNLQKQLDGIPAEDAKKNIQASGLSGILGSLTALMGVATKPDGSGGSTCPIPPELTAQLYNQKQKEMNFLNLLYGSTDESQKAYSQLQSEFKKAMADAKGDDANLPTSAKDIYDRLISKPMDTWGPTTTEIHNKLEDPKALDALEARMQVIETQVNSITKPKITDQKLGQLINDFYGDPGSGSSPYGALKRIQKGLDSLPADYKTRYGKLTGLDDLLTKIKTITTEAEELETGNFADNAKAKKLIEDSQDLVGQEKELYTQVDTTLKRARSYYLNQLKTYTQGTDKHKADPQVYSQAVFKMNSEVLQDTAAFTFNPTLQREDYGEALSMSVGQLDNYTKYFGGSGSDRQRSYLSVAFNFLDGQDPEGKKDLSPGVKQVLSDPMVASVKNNFCMKLLALTDIPNFIFDKNDKTGKTGECANASMTSEGEKPIYFRDFVKESVNERACVYQLYLEKENQESRSKVYSK